MARTLDEVIGSLPSDQRQDIAAASARLTEVGNPQRRGRKPADARQPYGSVITAIVGTKEPPGCAFRSIVNTDSV